MKISKKDGKIMTEGDPETKQDQSSTKQSDRIIEVSSRIGRGGKRVTVLVMPGENGEPGTIVDVVSATGKPTDPS